MHALVSPQTYAIDVLDPVKVAAAAPVRAEAKEPSRPLAAAPAHETKATDESTSATASALSPAPPVSALATAALALAEAKDDTTAPAARPKKSRKEIVADEHQALLHQQLRPDAARDSVSHVLDLTSSSPCDATARSMHRAERLHLISSDDDAPPRAAAKATAVSSYSDARSSSESRVLQHTSETRLLAPRSVASAASAPSASPHSTSQDRRQRLVRRRSSASQRTLVQEQAAYERAFAAAHDAMHSQVQPVGRECTGGDANERPVKEVQVVQRGDATHERESVDVSDSGASASTSNVLDALLAYVPLEFSDDSHSSSRTSAPPAVRLLEPSADLAASLQSELSYNDCSSAEEPSACPDATVTDAKVRWTLQSLQLLFDKIVRRPESANRELTPQDFAWVRDAVKTVTQFLLSKSISQHEPSGYCRFVDAMDAAMEHVPTLRETLAKCVLEWAATRQAH